MSTCVFRDETCEDASCFNIEHLYQRPSSQRLGDVDTLFASDCCLGMPFGCVPSFACELACALSPRTRPPSRLYRQGQRSPTENKYITHTYGVAPSSSNICICTRRHQSRAWTSYMFACFTIASRRDPSWQGPIHTGPDSCEQPELATDHSSFESGSQHRLRIEQLHLHPCSLALELCSSSADAMSPVRAGRSSPAGTGCMKTLRCL